MILRLRPEDLAAVAAHGARAYPEECCGLLAGPVGDDFGSPGAVLAPSEVLPLDNAWEGKARANRFRFDGLALARAERALEARGLGILGVYHSHPDAPAWPSPFDLENAWPSYAYLIVSVRGGKAGEARAWLLSEDRRSFLEGTVETKESLCPS